MGHTQLGRSSSLGSPSCRMGSAASMDPLESPQMNLFQARHLEQPIVSCVSQRVSSRRRNSFLSSSDEKSEAIEAVASFTTFCKPSLLSCR
eukprot:scaffold179_cov368-Prasinococcus_capsulatus_cf.AAC.11